MRTRHLAVLALFLILPAQGAVLAEEEKSRGGDGAALAPAPVPKEKAPAGAEAGAEEAGEAPEAPPAPRQEKDADGKGEEIELEPLEVVSRKKLLDFPGHADVLDRESFVFDKPSSMQDVFRKVPGVFVGTEDPRGLKPNIRIRGIGTGRSHDVLFFVDGVPANQMLWGYTDAHIFLPSQQMEKVEVIKGGASVLYGPCTIAGVVNMITRAVPREPTLFLSEKMTLHQHSEAGPASLDTLVYAGGTWDGVGLLVNYTNRTGHGYRQHDSFHVNDLLVKFRFDTGERSHLELKFNYFDVVSDTPRTLTLAAWDADPRDSLDHWSWFEGARYQGHVIYENDFGAYGRLKATFYAQQYERNWWAADCPPYPPTTNKGWVRLYDFVGFNPRYELDLDDVAGTKHEIKTGARLHLDRETDLGLTSDDPTADIGTYTKLGYNESISLSGYIEDKITLLPGFSMTPGFRVEYFQYILDDFLNGERGDASGFEPVFSVGALWEVGRGAFYANVNRTVRPVRIRELINPYTYEKNNVKSGWALNYEAGFKSAHLDGLKAEVSVFFIDFQDQPKSTTVPGEFVNIGRTWHYGVETGFELSARRLLSLPDDDMWGGFGLWGNVVFLRGVIMNGPYEGNIEPYTPRWTANLALTFRWKNLEAEVGCRYRDECFHDLDNTRDPSADGKNGRIPSHLVWHWKAELAFRLGSSEYKLFGGMHNVFDLEYFDYRHTWGPGGIAPAAGRTFEVGLSASF